MPPDMATAMLPLCALSAFPVKSDCEEYVGAVVVAMRREIDWSVSIEILGARILLLPRTHHLAGRSIV